MSDVSLDRVSKRFGGSAAVEDISVEVRSGQFLTLLGPSGCGKSTTLRIVAGLARPDAGIVRIDGRDVTALDASARNIGMVFQSLALFPHLTVEKNVAFGLEMRRVPASSTRERVGRSLEMVRLDGLANRYPHQLSGGQQQRVALARALVIEPAIIILDEPFGALDRKLREAMQEELHRLTRTLRITALFVTHDQEEALMLSDRIAVMNQGRIEQIGTPAEIFHRPATRFVADFMGATNFLRAQVLAVAPDEVRLAAAGLAVAVPWSGPPPESGAPLLVSVRPERVKLYPGAREGIPAVRGRVLQAIYHGRESSYQVRLGSGEILVARDPNDGAASGPRFDPGSTVWAGWTGDAVQVPREGESAVRA